ISAMGGRPFGSPEPFGSIEEIVERASGGGLTMLTAAPLMHGAAQWVSFTAFTTGGTIVLSPDPTRFDPDQILRVVESERITTVQLVGDAMARPLIEAIEAGSYDLSGMIALTNGGAALSVGLKDR